MADGTEERALVAVLGVLTALSGYLDALTFVSARVFTANMTGNVAVLGFSAAGAPGFSAPASAIALAAFVCGAALGGLAAARLTGRRLAVAMLSVEIAGTGLAALLGAVLGTRPGTAGGWAVIAALSLAMGSRNAIVGRLGVADMTTTVLTRTVAGLVSDLAHRGRRAPNTLRRVASVVLLCGGAAVGTLALRGLGETAALWAATALTAATLLGYAAALRAGR